MVMRSSLDASRRHGRSPVHSKWRHGALARYGALGGALRERTINRKPRPSMLIPPRDIESSGGFSGMASSGGFSGMDLGFSVWVSPTENWYFPPLGFCF
jgi:hypothetical protein